MKRLTTQLVPFMPAITGSGIPMRSVPVAARLS